MTRPYLVLSHEQRDLTARFLKTLSAIERAHALGDTDDFEYVLGNVDPVDLKELIAVVESAGREPSSGGPERSRTSSIPLPDAHRPPHRSGASLPAAPYPEVVHGGDTWARRSA